YYAGVIYDGIRQLPTFVFSDMGGIDIEEVAEQHPDHIGRGHFSTVLPHMDFRAKDTIASIGITGSELNRLTPILSNLARLFVKYDMTLAEINPLARLEDGTFVAVDAHMDMENEGRPRQKALLKELGVGDEETRESREPTPFEIEGERIDAVDHRGVAGNVTEFDGNLGLVIGAGGGSLTLFDAVRRYGGKPANYCEIGGNPSVSKAKNLTKLVLSKPGVDKIAVMMSIVSNTRVDIVARGVTVPPAFTKDAVFEAIEAGVKLVVIVTERIPRFDVAQMVELAGLRGARIIGPNCLGIIRPGIGKMGGIGGPAKDAQKAYKPGRVGVMSRSGGMTTEISSTLSAAGLGASTAVSIGGCAVTGSSYAALMPLFEQDEQTEAIVIYTEPGGRME